MRDGKTRKHRSAAGAPRMQELLDHYVAKVMLVSGPDAGAGFAIDRESHRRPGPGVDRAFDDPAMSRQHAAIEFSGTGFRIRDLGSTNGTIAQRRGRAVRGSCVTVIASRSAGVFVLAVEERSTSPTPTS